MKVLILDSYYDAFLKRYYNSFGSQLSPMDYQSHLNHLMDQHFGTSDAYSFYMKKEGWEAAEVVTNDPVLQQKWAKENGIKVLLMPPFATKGMNRFMGLDWRFKIIKAQIQKYKPDILFIQERNILTDQFLMEMKPSVRFIVSQIASPIPKWRNFRPR